MQPGAAISESIGRATSGGSPALVAFLTAGFPDRDSFSQHLAAVTVAADVVEIGVPFSDPMADGATIQRASRVALEDGATLTWILEALAAQPAVGEAPRLLMSYLNPLLTFGFGRLAYAARLAGVSGFIVPDLPWEECGEIRDALNREGIALVQMVTPVTSPGRLAMLAGASQGFAYAVTSTGTTGLDVALEDATLEYLTQVRTASTVPVCAGFGIRSAAQVARVAGRVDGVIVGSALVEAIERGEDAGEWLNCLRERS